MGSSLPNHDAKGLERIEKKPKKAKGKLHQTRLERKQQLKISLYMMHEQNSHMMHTLMH